MSDIVSALSLPINFVFFRDPPVLMECPKLYSQYSSSMRIQDCSRSFDRAQLLFDALFDEIRVHCLLGWVSS